MRKLEITLAILLVAFLAGAGDASPGKDLFGRLATQIDENPHLVSEKDADLIRIMKMARAGQVARADAELRRLRQANSPLPNVYLLSALMQVKSLNFDGALTSINRYIAMRGEKNAADGYLMRAQIHYLKGRPNEALADYDRCLKTGDDAYKLLAMEQKGDLLMVIGRGKEALPCLDKCVDLARGIGGKYLGRVLARAECYDKLGMYDQAVKDYSLYASRVDSLESWLKYCRCLVAAGKNAKALSTLNALLLRHPSCHEAVVIRADLKEKMGDKKGALEDIELLLKLDPQSPEWQAKRKELRGDASHRPPASHPKS